MSFNGLHDLKWALWILVGIMAFWLNLRMAMRQVRDGTAPFQSCSVYLNHFLYLFRLKKIRAGMGNFAYPVPFNFLFYFFYTN